MKTTVTVRRLNKNRIAQIVIKSVEKHGKEVEDGVMDAAQVWMDESQKIVPKDTGSLSHTGVVRKEGDLFNTTAIIGYGTYGVQFSKVPDRKGNLVDRHPFDYALIAHFNAFSNGAGFLTEPMYTKRPEIRAAFLARIKTP